MLTMVGGMLVEDTVQSFDPGQKSWLNYRLEVLGSFGVVTPIIGRICVYPSDQIASYVLRTNRILLQYGLSYSSLRLYYLEIHTRTSRGYFRCLLELLSL
jgi:hypothetical protein